jgi:ParB family transcriptional regulator, chromosome partitioning protein
MTMQSVSLSALEASTANPRRKIDRKTIEGLAASIRTDGLLHNLVVSPVKGNRVRYSIVSGARRFHALKLLEDRGELPEDFTVPVEIRTFQGRHVADCHGREPATAEHDAAGRSGFN